MAGKGTNYSELYGLWACGDIPTIEALMQYTGWDAIHAARTITRFPPPYCRQLQQHPMAHKHIPDLVRRALAIQQAHNGPMPHCGQSCKGCPHSVIYNINNNPSANVESTVQGSTAGVYSTGNSPMGDSIRGCNTVSNGNTGINPVGDGSNEQLGPRIASSDMRGPDGAAADGDAGVDAVGPGDDVLRVMDNINAAMVDRLQALAGTGVLGPSDAVHVLRGLNEAARLRDYLRGRAPDQRRVAVEEHKLQQVSQSITVVTQIRPPPRGAAGDEGRS